VLRQMGHAGLSFLFHSSHFLSSPLKY
jgi:hypothetical protein